MNAKPWILVADDKHGTALAVENELTSYGYSVDVVNQLHLGLSALSSGKYSVAIVDLDFTGMSSGVEPNSKGLRIVEEALKTPFLETIVITAYPTWETCAQSLEKGVFRYLAKDASERNFVKQLPRIVEQALALRAEWIEVENRIKAAQHDLLELERGGGNSAIIDATRHIIIGLRDLLRRIRKSRGRNP